MSLFRHDIRLGNVCYQVNTYHDFQRGIWAKGKDIATLVGYENTSQTIRLNVFSENQKTWEELLNGVVIDFDPAVFRHNTIFINECGMFQLIFKSKDTELLKAFMEHMLPNLKNRTLNDVPPITKKQLMDLCQALETQTIKIIALDKENNLLRSMLLAPPEVLRQYQAPSTPPPSAQSGSGLIHVRRSNRMSVIMENPYRSPPHQPAADDNHVTRPLPCRRVPAFTDDFFYVEAAYHETKKTIKLSRYKHRTPYVSKLLYNKGFTKTVFKRSGRFEPLDLAKIVSMLRFKGSHRAKHIFNEILNTDEESVFNVLSSIYK